MKSNMKNKANVLHVLKAVVLSYNRVKIPFTLANTLSEKELRAKLLAAAAVKHGKCEIAGIKMCHPTFGYVTFTKAQAA